MTDDLDTLLNESLTIAAAKRAARTRTASVEDEALVREVEVAITWHPVAAIARLVETTCHCGAVHTQFDSWFICSHHRMDKHARRFIRSNGHNDLPAYQYIAQETSLYCHECLANPALPLATIDIVAGLDALGASPAAPPQLPIAFPTINDLLADLDEGDDE